MNFVSRLRTVIGEKRFSQVVRERADLVRTVLHLALGENPHRIQAREIEAVFGRLHPVRELLLDENLPVDSPDDPQMVHETLVDAPLSVRETLLQSRTLVDIHARVQSGFYADKLVVITCLEKSSSTLLEICVRELLTASGVPHTIGIQKRVSSGPFNHVGALYPKILLYAPEGGVLRGVLQPRFFNLYLLKSWGCKHLILLRHPADRLVGRYCDPRPLFQLGHDRWRIEPQYLIHDIFDPGLAPEDAFEELISGGYLLDTLTWMAEWLRLCDPEKSLIVRYEDMQQDDLAYFLRIQEFLFDKPLSEELAETLRDYRVRYRKDFQPGTKSERRYPRGYSGEVGIWRPYFSPGNVASYRRVVGAFLENHPHAKRVLDFYPNLMI